MTASLFTQVISPLSTLATWNMVFTLGSLAPPSHLMTWPMNHSLLDLEQPAVEFGHLMLAVAAYRREFYRLPTVDHRNAEPVCDFQIVIWQTSAAKGDMSREEYLAHCIAVVNSSTSPRSTRTPLSLICRGMSLCRRCLSFEA